MFGKKKPKVEFGTHMENQTPAEEAFLRIFPTVVYDGFKKTMGLMLQTGVLKLEKIDQSKGEKPPIDIETVIAAGYVAMLRIASMDGTIDPEVAKKNLDIILSGFAEEGTMLSLKEMKKLSDEIGANGGCGDPECTSCAKQEEGNPEDKTITASAPAGVTKH